MRVPWVVKEFIVGALMVAGIVAITSPLLNQVRINFRYKSELVRLHKVFSTCSLYAGSYDDQFPFSISEHDRFMMSMNKEPAAPLAKTYWDLPTTCTLLSETSSYELCKSIGDVLPDDQQLGTKKQSSWHSMIGSSFNTSSLFGIYHVSFATTWNCPAMPMFWSFPYKDVQTDPIRATYFNGETKYVSPEEFSQQIECLNQQFRPLS